MVPIAGFSEKSSTSTFYLQFVHISSFFQFFPKPASPIGLTAQPHMRFCSDESGNALALPQRLQVRSGPRTTAKGRISDRLPHMRIFCYFQRPSIWPQFLPKVDQPIGLTGTRNFIPEAKIQDVPYSLGKLSRRGNSNNSGLALALLTKSRVGRQRKDFFFLREDRVSGNIRLLILEVPVGKKDIFFYYNIFF